MIGAMVAWRRRCEVWVFRWSGAVCRTWNERVHSGSEEGGGKGSESLLRWAFVWERRLEAGRRKFFLVPFYLRLSALSCAVPYAMRGSMTGAEL